MSELKLTALVFESETPGVYIGRIKEIGGIFAQNDSVRAVLSDLDRTAWYMVHDHKQAQAKALLAQQLPEAENWISSLAITHDVEASQAEQGWMRSATKRPPAPAMPDTPAPQLLSAAARTQLIRRVCLAPHIANADIDAINAAFDAQEAYSQHRLAVADQLRRLLFPESGLTGLDGATQTQLILQNKAVCAAAKALDIEL